eukprot:6610445-Pyramimonas_sp.AAC.1
MGQQIHNMVGRAFVAEHSPGRVAGNAGICLLNAQQSHAEITQVSLRTFLTVSISSRETRTASTRD